MKFICVNLLFVFLLLVTGICNAAAVESHDSNPAVNALIIGSTGLPLPAAKDTIDLENAEIESDSLIYHDAQDSLLVPTTNLGIRINHDVNQIGNPKALSRFFENMITAQSDVTPAVSIYHIGDSHVAGKYYPNSVAKHLHDLYGEGKTVIITPKIKVRHKHSVLSKKKKGKHRAAIATPITGKHAAHQATTTPAKPKKSKRKRAGHAAVDQTPMISAPLAMLGIKLSKFESRLTPASYQTDSPLEFDLNAQADTAKRQRISLDYAAYGVPGKSFKYFTESPGTREHLAAFKPQLVIISLGVNDIFGKRFDDVYIEDNLTKLVALVRHNAPNADILLGITTDAYVKRKKSNPFLPKLKKLMIRFAENNNCAYWDPAPVFGGYGCMNRWYKQNLCIRDRVHLTAAGYTLLGEMLVEALDKGFMAYVDKR